MKRRAVVKWAGHLVATILVFEGLSFVGYRILTSQFFSYSTVAEYRKTVLAKTATVQPATEMRADVRNWTFSHIILHPFLGYTIGPRPGNTGYTFSQTTIHKEAGQSSDNRKIIGITGGSVAEGFYQHVENEKN